MFQRISALVQRFKSILFHERIAIMLWSGVCISVHLKLVFYRNVWTDWAGLWHRGHSHLFYTV